MKILKRIAPSFWPNSITLLNLSLGMLAIMLITLPGIQKDRIFIPAFLVVVAALTDRFDGQLARRLKAESELGKQLDSLADLVSFGVAPPLIAWRLSLFQIRIFGVLICLIFVTCGAFRLARYNVTEFDGVYVGMPITMAGALVGMICLLATYILTKRDLGLIFAIVFAFIMLILSYFMICKISIKKR